MIEQNVLSTYIAGETSLREVADACGTDHHRVKRILNENGVEIVKARRKPFTKEHRQSISRSTKGRISWIKGKQATPEMVYKNMAAHLRFDISWQWLSKFDDIEKLKTLNKCISKRTSRFDVTTDWYRQYILKFWDCSQFNKVYDRWIESGKDSLKSPHWIIYTQYLKTVTMTLITCNSYLGLKINVKTTCLRKNGIGLNLM